MVILFNGLCHITPISESETIILTVHYLNRISIALCTMSRKQDCKHNSISSHPLFTQGQNGSNDNGNDSKLLQIGHVFKHCCTVGSLKIDPLSPASLGLLTRVIHFEINLQESCVDMA